MSEAQILGIVDRLRARAASVGMRVALDEAWQRLACRVETEALRDERTMLTEAQKRVGWQHPHKVENSHNRLTDDPVATFLPWMHKKRRAA